MRRAAIMAAIVGCMIAVINHGNHIWAGTMSPVGWIKVGVTFLVPYTVSTISSVLALQEQGRLIAALREPTKDQTPAAPGSDLQNT